MGLLAYLSQDVIGVCRAILMLFLAYIVAGITKGIVLRLIDKTKLSQMFAKSEENDKREAGSTRVYVGKLVYLLVFLLFVPGIFSYLGVSQVAEPILRLLTQVWGFLPNMLGAFIVLMVGNLVAKLVRQLLVPVFERIGTDRLQEKAGMNQEGDGKLSVTLAYIVYVLILIPVIIVSLQVLGIEAIASPAISMLTMIFSFIPNIAVAVMIILLGDILGKLAGNIVRQVISASGMDLKVQKLLGEKGRGFSLSKVTATVVRVVIVIFFVVEGVSVLHLTVMSNIGANLIGYMPNVLAALVILLAAVLGADAAENALKKSGLTGFAMITRITIMTVGVFMILSQLGIAEQIVTKAFLLIVAALAVAFGVAFGVGGRNFASRQLDKLEKKLESAEDVKEAEEEK
ncbi:MAG: mechanosensitive ion channel [Lachnospiraceae bacterium]|nr:mechanosensitive ion channel [Lachnospiraceae bacterium]